MSAPVRPDVAHHGLGHWAKEVMDALGPQLAGRPKPVHLGISFGGATLMDLACVDPGVIQAAALMVPICIHPGAETVGGVPQYYRGRGGTRGPNQRGEWGLDTSEKCLKLTGGGGGGGCQTLRAPLIDCEAPLGRERIKRRTMWRSNTL